MIDSQPMNVELFTSNLLDDFTLPENSPSIRHWPSPTTVSRKMYSMSGFVTLVEKKQKLVFVTHIGTCISWSFASRLSFVVKPTPQPVFTLDFTPMSVVPTFNRCTHGVKIFQRNHIASNDLPPLSSIPSPHLVQVCSPDRVIPCVRPQGCAKFCMVRTRRIKESDCLSKGKAKSNAKKNNEICT